MKPIHGRPLCQVGPPITRPPNLVGSAPRNPRRRSPAATVSLLRAARGAASEAIPSRFSTPRPGAPSRPPLPASLDDGLPFTGGDGVRAVGGRRRGRAEPRRRGWAWGHSDASTTGSQAQRQQGQEADSSSSAGRRRGSKVAPEPKEHDDEPAALRHTPGSPSFRYYCQKTAAVDKIVADADAADGEGSIRMRGAATTRQASKSDDPTATNAHNTSEVTEHKEGTKWLRFRGLSVVTSAWHNLFNRHSSKALPPPAAESHPPPAAASAAAVTPHP